MSACNPYAPDYRVTCAGMLLPEGPPVNPYAPTFPTPTWDVYALALPVVEPTQQPAPWEDELRLPAWPLEVPDAAPVPEPSGLVVIGLVLAVGVRRWQRRRR